MALRVPLQSEVAGLHLRGLHGYEALGLFLAELDKEVAWFWGGSLAGVSVRKQQGHWLLMVKAVKNGRSFVMFSRGATLTDAYRATWRNIVKGTGLWKQDKYT